MKQNNFLYFATAATALFLVFLSGYFVLRTGQPSTDVLAEIEYTHPSIRVSDFDEGVVRTVLINQLPIIIWNRNANDMEVANAQNEPILWPIKFSTVSGSTTPIYALDENLTLDKKWFIAVAVNPERFGCVVLPSYGDFGGFFDPCRGGHFDLSGRIRKGASGQNLVIVSATFSDDGQSIKLDLSQVPNFRN